MEQEARTNRTVESRAASAHSIDHRRGAEEAAEPGTAAAAATMPGVLRATTAIISRQVQQRSPSPAFNPNSYQHRQNRKHCICIHLPHELTRCRRHHCALSQSWRCPPCTCRHLPRRRLQSIVTHIVQPSEQHRLPHKAAAQSARKRKPTAGDITLFVGIVIVVVGCVAVTFG